jgi:hypothetical protein
MERSASTRSRPSRSRRSSRRSPPTLGRRRVPGERRTETTLSAPDERESPHPRPRRTVAERLNTWVPMITAVAALALSSITWIQSRATPEVTMNLPSIMRIGGASFDVYVQPSFSVPRRYDSLARIAGVQLEFTRDDDTPGQAAQFFWSDSGGFGEYAGGGFGWTYAADPAPFVVGHEEPQRPTIRFHTEQQSISPGRWTGTITAHREKGQDPLVERFCVLVDEADMADYGQHDLIDFRSDIPDSRTDCYWRPDSW